MCTEWFCYTGRIVEKSDIPCYIMIFMNFYLSDYCKLMKNVYACDLSRNHSKLNNYLNSSVHAERHLFKSCLQVKQRICKDIYLLAEKTFSNVRISKLCFIRGRQRSLFGIFEDLTLGTLNVYINIILF